MTPIEPEEDEADFEDDLEDEESGEQGCPYCGKSSCQHLLIASSVYNEDWDGPFEEASRAVTEALEKVVFAAYQADCAPLYASDALEELLSRVRDAAPGSVDEVPGQALRGYWLARGRETSGVELRQYVFEGDSPGSGEKYRDLYAEHPKQATKALLKAAKEDIAHLKRELPARPRRRATK